MESPTSPTSGLFEALYALFMLIQAYAMLHVCTDELILIRLPSVEGLGRRSACVMRKNNGVGLRCGATSAFQAAGRADQPSTITTIDTARLSVVVVRTLVTVESDN
jgi:hypothetical protein